jgi:hypothetical protein
MAKPREYYLTRWRPTMALSPPPPKIKFGSVFKTITAATVILLLLRAFHIIR